MRVFGFLVASLVFVSGSAFAQQDAGTLEVSRWTGAYGGIQFGYGLGESDWRLQQNAGGSPSSQIGSVVTSHDMDGVLGGIQLGYSRQTGAYVIGIEGDISATGMDGYSTWLNDANLFRDASTDVQWIATAAARIGRTFGNTLAFLKVGAAFAGEDYRHTGGQANNPRELSEEDVRLGFVAGIGVEHALTDRWSAKLEYDYLGFGEDDISLTDGSATAVFGIDQGISVFKAGVNYRFGPR